MERNVMVCPYCQEAVDPGAQVTTCSHCQTIHHRDCWDTRNGCCVMGCAGRFSKGVVSLAKEKDQEVSTKTCPYCAETILQEAIRCRYCQMDLTGTTQVSSEARAPVAQPLLGGVSVMEALKFGWDRVFSQIGFLIGMQLLVGFLFVVGSIIVFIVTGIAPSLETLVTASDSIFTAFLMIGVFRILLKIADGHSVSMQDLFSGWDVLLAYTIVFLVTIIATSLGLILLVIPGLVVSALLIFAPILVIDERLGVGESLKESINMAKDHIWALVGFSLVAIFINVLGFLVLGVGLFVTIPMSGLALIYIYRAMRPARP